MKIKSKLNSPAGSTSIKTVKTPIGSKTTITRTPNSGPSSTTKVTKSANGNIKKVDNSSASRTVQKFKSSTGLTSVRSKNKVTGKVTGGMMVSADPRKK